MSLWTTLRDVGKVAGAAYLGYTYAPAIASTAKSIFDALPAGAAAGAATLAGSVMTNSTNRDLASQQMAFSAQQAGSIYQRGAADMIAAGLNPILAYANPAQVASYQQPQIQNALGLAANAAVSAYAAEGQYSAHKAAAVGSHAGAYRDTETGHTVKARRPGEVSQLENINKHLLAQIEAISFGNRLTEANTAKSIAETGLTHAQTQVATAQSAELRQRALTGASQEALNRTMETVQKGLLDMQKVQQIVMYADAALKSKQANQAMSATELNKAQEALAKVNSSLVDAKRLGIEPEASFNRDFPRFTEALAGMREVFRSIPGLSILMKEGLVP